MFPWYQILATHLFLLIFSSCVDELEVCKGIPQCSNKEDLKWCKNATSWSLPHKDWISLRKLVRCTHPGQPEYHPGQWIPSAVKGDGLFQCYNRATADEDPFSLDKNKNAQKTWLELVHTPCDFGWSRCLGRSDQCVNAYCKSFFELKVWIIETKTYSIKWIDITPNIYTCLPF